MPPSDGKTARKRLGEMLIQARVEMDLRYRNRALFARERNLNERLIQDAETGYRGGFRSATKFAIERAYGWEAGSIDRVLAGGEPVPLTRVRTEDVMDLIREAWGDVDYAPEFIQRIFGTERWSAEEKLSLVRSYIDSQQNPGGPGSPGDERESRSA